MDVLLKWVVDESICVPNTAVALDPQDALPAHSIDEVSFDLRVPEVKEVPGVVPNEPITPDSPAVAADLVFRFDDQVVPFAQPICKCEATHAGADDQIARAFHATGLPHPRAAS